MVNDDPKLDPQLTPNQEKNIGLLGQSDRDLIDRLILKHCSREWQKVAKICGTVLFQSHEIPDGIPDLYVARRIYDFTKDGYLEYQGLLGAMRFCEVRISIKL